MDDGKKFSVLGENCPVVNVKVTMTLDTGQEVTFELLPDYLVMDVSESDEPANYSVRLRGTLISAATGINDAIYSRAEHFQHAITN